MLDSLPVSSKGDAKLFLKQGWTISGERNFERFVVSYLPTTAVEVVDCAHLQLT